jgi:hypothetical protein
VIQRSLERFDLYPGRILGDSAYGSAEMLGWLLYEHGIEPHVTRGGATCREGPIADITEFYAYSSFFDPLSKSRSFHSSLASGAPPTRPDQEIYRSHRLDLPQGHA